MDMRHASGFRMSESGQFRLLDKFHIFSIQGTRKRGHKLLSVIGAYFPANTVSSQVVNKYLEEKIYPELGAAPFSVLYVHTGVERSRNFPGISALGSICHRVPAHQIHALYFLHPGLQARLFLATFHHLIFTPSLYEKVRYLKRVEFLWEHAWRKEMQLPEFVYNDDQESDQRPLMDYSLESDHPRCFTQAFTADSAIRTFSTRCIA